MPRRRPRRTHKEQCKQRLVNLITGPWPSEQLDINDGEISRIEETRRTLQETPWLRDLGHAFGGKDDYPPWIVAARLGWQGMLQVYLDHIRQSGLSQDRITNILDQADPSGDTPLKAAAIEGNSWLIPILVQAGATPAEQLLMETLQDR